MCPAAEAAATRVKQALKRATDLLKNQGDNPEDTSVGKHMFLRHDHMQRVYATVEVFDEDSMLGARVLSSLRVKCGTIPDFIHFTPTPTVETCNLAGFSED